MITTKKVKYFNNGLNNNNGNEDDDDNNDRNLGNYDNAHANANKGRRQYVASSFSGNDCCGQVLDKLPYRLMCTELTLFVHRIQELQDRLESNEKGIL
jgi:hypothetical protein